MPKGIWKNRKRDFLSVEHRKKISESEKGHKHTEETKLKMSETHKRIGTKPPSPLGRKLSKESRLKISLIHKGKKLSEETKRRISEAHKGMKKPWATKSPTEETRKRLREINLGKKHSEETKRKISEANYKRYADNLELRKELSEKSKGQNNPNWNGGHSPERQSAYARSAWKELAKSILKRDNYQCQKCGGRSEIVHHRRQWSKYPEYRFTPSNLITLCKNCHKEIHKKKLINWLIP